MREHPNEQIKINKRQEQLYALIDDPTIRAEAYNAIKSGNGEAIKNTYNKLNGEADALGNDLTNEVKRLENKIQPWLR